MGGSSYMQYVTNFCCDGVTAGAARRILQLYQCKCIDFVVVDMIMTIFYFILMDRIDILS